MTIFSHEHKPLCGFVKNKEVFSQYDCDGNLIYEVDFNGII